MTKSGTRCDQPAVPSDGSAKNPQRPPLFTLIAFVCLFLVPVAWIAAMDMAVNPASPLGVSLRWNRFSFHTSLALCVLAPFAGIGAAFLGSLQRERWEVFRRIALSLLVLAGALVLLWFGMVVIEELK